MGELSPLSDFLDKIPQHRHFAYEYLCRNGWIL